MRRNLIFGLLIVGSMTLMSSMCSSDDDSNNNSSNVNIEELENISTDGTWRITLFEDSGNNETSDFNNYTFTFGTGGNVTAVNGDNTITGMWSVSNDSSSDDDDSSSNPIDFNLFFDVGENHNFEDLNDDWDIESYTDTKIHLRDVSGGDGSVDVLIFEKN